MALQASIKACFYIGNLISQRIGTIQISHNKKGNLLGFL